MNLVAPRVREKQQFAEELQIKYKQEKDKKFDDEQKRRIAKAQIARSAHIDAIAVQLKRKQKDTEAELQNQADLDKKQLDYKAALDEEKRRKDAEKNLKIRQNAQG